MRGSGVKGEVGFGSGQGLIPTPRAMDRARTCASLLAPGDSRLSGCKARRTVDRPRTRRWHATEGDAAVPVCVWCAPPVCVWCAGARRLCACGGQVARGGSCVAWCSRPRGGGWGSLTLRPRGSCRSGHAASWSTRLGPTDCLWHGGGLPCTQLGRSALLDRCCTGGAAYGWTRSPRRRLQRVEGSQGSAWAYLGHVAGWRCYRPRKRRGPEGTPPE